MEPSSVKSICVVRLSALGDVVLALPAVKALATQLPNAKVTWVVQRSFLPVVAELEGMVELIGIDKPQKLGDYFAFKKAMRDRKFDVLLAMQASFRINLLFACIRAQRKIGFDARRARDLHGLFVDERVPRADHHLLDGFMSFAEALGVESPEISWNPKIAECAVCDSPYIVLNPGTSKPERNWSAERYGELSRRVSEEHSIKIVLTGGRSDAELALGEAIVKAVPTVQNLMGQTSIPQLFGVLKQARLVISPDTGPVHMAVAVGTPVVGLYGVARSALSGPYFNRAFTVDRYDEAVQAVLKKSSQSVDWHTRVHDAAAMELISVEAVAEKVTQALKGEG